jgi:hypothetical protein
MRFTLLYMVMVTSAKFAVAFPLKPFIERAEVLAPPSSLFAASRLAR